MEKNISNWGQSHSLTERIASKYNHKILENQHQNLYGFESHVALK
jgi:hypothetical protein